MKTDRIILAGLLILIAGCDGPITKERAAEARQLKAIADNERARKVCQSQGKKIAPLDIWRPRDGVYMCQAQCQIPYEPGLKTHYKVEGQPWECGK